MSSISIGPLSLPLLPLIFIVAWFAAQQVAAWTAPREQRAAAAGAVGAAGVVGLVAARAAYVLANLDVYRDTPLAMVDFRDGGWIAWAGLIAGLAWLAAVVLRKRAGARAIMIAALLGVGGWWGASAWITSQQATRLPAVALQRLGSNLAEPLAASYTGKAFVVNLWATWCAPCREEMPAFAQVQRERPDVPIVFVNQGESLAAARAYLAKLPQPLDNVWLDAQGSLGRAIDARGLPTTVFVDAQGRVRRIHSGVMNRAALRAQIDALR